MGRLPVLAYQCSTLGLRKLVKSIENFQVESYMEFCTLCGVVGACVVLLKEPHRENTIVVYSVAEAVTYACTPYPSLTVLGNDEPRIPTKHKRYIIHDFDGVAHAHGTLCATNIKRSPLP